jgi:tape measure domain-containing protein
MAADQTLELEVTLENGKFKVSSKEVNDQIKKTGDSVDAAGEKGKTGFSKLTGGMKAFAAAAKATVVLALVAGFVKLVKTSLQSAAAMEKQKIALTTMLKSGAKANKLLKDITSFAAKTPFQLPGLIESSKRLLAFGVANEEVIPTLEKLGNAASGNAETLDRLTLAYGKVRAKGKASLEEINMFTEAGVPLMQSLADAQGVTTERMFKLISTGKVGFKEVNDALTNLTTGSGKFAGMLEKQSQSLGGLFSTLKDQLGLLILDFGSKLSPAFKNLIKSFMLGTKSGSLFADILGIMATLTGKFVNTLALAIQGIQFLAINTQRAWVQFQKLKFLIENGLNPGFEETITLNVELQKQWDGLISKETELRQQSQKTTNMMSDTLEEIFSLQEDVNKEKEKSIEIDKKAQRIQAQKDSAVGTGKKGGGPGDGFEKRLKDRNTLLKEFYGMQISKEEQVEFERRERQNRAALEYEAHLNHKLGLDTVYAKGLMTVMNTAAVFMAEKNKKLFRFGQVLAIGQTWINTFQGMMKAYAQLGPIAGPAGAAIVLGAGVLSTRKIAAQKPPEFAVGSVNIPSTSPAIVHRGEMILSKPIAEGVRSGELSVGGPGAAGGMPPINVSIDGRQLFEINEEKRDEAAQNLGSEGSFAIDSPY